MLRRHLLGADALSAAPVRPFQVGAGGCGLSRRPFFTLYKGEFPDPSRNS